MSKQEQMNAVVVEDFGDANQLIYKQIDAPQAKENQVRIKIQATGVNPNEAYVLTGNYNLFVPSLPFIPGFDGAGVIDQVGSNVTNFSIGDRVFVGTFKKKEQSGTYAEKLVVDSDIVLHLPDNVTFEDGASIGIPGFTAYHALFQRAKIKAGETVFIHGATGGVGTLAVQMAKAIGATVIGTSSHQEGLDAIINNGADYAMNHLNEDNLTELMSYTNNQGPDVIIEFLANKNLEIDMKAVKTKGRIVVIGARDTIEISPRLILSRNLNILGAALPNLTEAEYDEIAAGISAFLQNGLLKPVIGEKVPLKDAKKVHEELLTRFGKGKTILVPEE